MTAIALKEKLESLTKKMTTAHAEASSGGGFDFDLVKSLSGKDSAEKLNEYRKLNEDMDATRKQIETLELAERNSRAQQEREAEQKVDPEVTKKITKNGKEFDTIGEAIVKSDAFRLYKNSRTPLTVFDENVSIKQIGTHQSGAPAGYLPQSIRVPGLIIDVLYQRPMVVDVVPESPVTTGIVSFMRENAATPSGNVQAAAERQEGAVYEESGYTFTPDTDPVRSIGHYVVVTDELMEDVAAMEGMLNNRLTGAIRRHVSSQMINGAGTGVTLQGILHTSNSETRNKAANTSTPDIILEVLTARQAAHTDPNVLVIHPTNWSVVRGLKDANRNYVFGNPAANVVDNLWGLNPIVTSEIPLNTALVGDFTHCMQWMRRGIEIETGFIADDFKKGQKSIRAGVRVGFTVFRKAAFENIKTLNTAQHP